MPPKRNPKHRRVRPTLKTGKGRTKASFASECDINNIMRRYDREGVITHLSHVKARYADVCDVGDYRAAMQRVAAVNTIFEELPSKLREVFDNDPATFLDEVQSADQAQLEAWGLADERETREKLREVRETKKAEKADRIDEIQEKAAEIAADSEPEPEKASA